MRAPAPKQARCRADGLECEEVLVPERNHFSVVEALSDIGGPLSSRLTTMMFGTEKPG